jgi:hypothetical protein
MVALLAAEGFLLLRPNGTLVRLARRGRDPEGELAASWWRNSPVHMGCSIPSCTRPATRTASYRQASPRGVLWRAYGFCDLHSPPSQVTGLVYRLGRPPAFAYDVPLTPLWTEIYFLLGMAGFGLWCAVMWRYVGRGGLTGWLCLILLHGFILTGLWSY